MHHLHPFLLAYCLLLGGCQVIARRSAWVSHVRFGNVACGHGPTSLALQPREKQSCTTALPEHVPGEKRHVDAGSLGELQRWLLDNGAELELHGLALKCSAKTERPILASVPDTAGSQGLMAMRAYRRGDILLSIPSSLHFTVEVIEQLVRYVVGGDIGSGSESKEDVGVFGSGRSTTDQKAHLAFLLALFQESLKEQWTPGHIASGYAGGCPLLARLLDGWIAYLNLLPPPLRTIPMFWTTDELNALDHPISHAVMERLHCLRSSFRHAEAALRRHISLMSSDRPHQPESTENLFQSIVAAYATVVSRSISMPTTGNVFVPLVDLCNHSSRDANAKLRLIPHNSNSEEVGAEVQPPVKKHHQALGMYRNHRSLQLVATRDISVGEEIHICYGAFDNPTLLLNYGLLPQENPHERIQIEFSPRRVHSALQALGVDLIMLTDDFTFLGQRVVNGLIDLGLAAAPANRGEASKETVPYRPVVTVTGDSRPDERLLAAAKVITGESGYFSSAEERQGVGNGGAFSILDERTRTLAFLISFLQHALFEQFSTTATEDSVILRDLKVPKHVSPLGLEQTASLTAGMEVAVRFRAKRREVLREAITRMQQSINSIRTN